MGRLTQNILEHIVDSVPLLIPRETLLHVLEIVEGKTAETATGFPWISEQSFSLLTKKVPHLFDNGRRLLNQVIMIEEFIEENADDYSAAERNSFARAIKVLKNITHTACITAPADLWILRHILSVHKRIGLVDEMLAHEINGEDFCRQQGLNAKQLAFDLSMLTSRGLLLRHDNGNFGLANTTQAKEVYSQIKEIPRSFAANMVDEFLGLLQGRGQSEVLAEFLSLKLVGTKHVGWTPGLDSIEIGFRLVPLVLAMRVLNLSQSLRYGASFAEVVSHGQALVPFLKLAGMLNPESKVSRVGERCFNRGSGPFGIIHAYYPYMARLEDRLRDERQDLGVARAANVAASQDANAKTFAAANEALDKFCRQYPFKFRVFIEHAVGRGEATRQRFERAGEASIQYFGADLEDDAINAAVEQQSKGLLPQNMKFIRHADIGNPDIVIEGVRKAGFDCQGSVMMVGNGFHEIRHQSNEKMIAVLGKYQEAGILLIFTEETALTDDDLVQTAWNTYHAGFRYVHDISGQGLRPANERAAIDRMGWHRCATEAGYTVLDELSHRSRTIYPFAKTEGYNPAISMTYFCVPSLLVEELRVGG